KFTHIEGVPHILRVHKQVDFAVGGHGQFSADNVVTGVDVVGGIGTDDSGVAFVDLVGMKVAKLAVRARIAEIECELSGLRLNLESIRLGWSEVDGGPGSLSENSKCKHFRAD